MAWFAGHYATGEDPDRTRACRPSARPDLSGLPPAVVATAEYDPLRDQGDAYADALEQAGVPVVKRGYDGLIHGFFDLVGAQSRVCRGRQRARAPTCAACWSGARPAWRARPRRS